MTYEELVKKAQEIYADADASKVNEHVAIQFNVTGEAEGAFYLEIKDGKVDVQPYEYYDRDVIVTTTAETLVAIVDGKLGLEAAYLTGKVKAEGNLGKALLLKDVAAKKPAKKAPAKKAAAKPAAKKTPAKKAEAKAEVKAEVKEEVKAPAKAAEEKKAEAKKAPAKKAPAKKAEAKAEVKAEVKEEVKAEAKKAPAKKAPAKKTAAKKTEA